jgi:tripartite-type tricarboxylate transporter receptor subunit TctC
MTNKLRRRQFLQLAAGAAAVLPWSRTASALDYPTRPVRLIVGFPAASATDIVARVIAQPLSAQLTQQVIVDNRPGAGSNIGTEAVVGRRPTAIRCSGRPWPTRSMQRSTRIFRSISCATLRRS